jgi:hypothetical protein
LAYNRHNHHRLAVPLPPVIFILGLQLKINVVRGKDNMERMHHLDLTHVSAHMSLAKAKPNPEINIEKDIQFSPKVGQ